MTDVGASLASGHATAGTMRIRAATDADVPSIADICTRATRQAYEPLVGDAYVARVIAHWYGADRLRREIARTDRWFGFSIAERGGVPLGVGGTGLAAEPSTCELFTLYVDPRCQRQGAGRALVADAMRQARAARASRLQVAVMPGNGPAIAFYEACGFEPAGERPIYAPHGAFGGPDMALVYIART